MNILIVYGTKHGSTKLIADMIKSSLKECDVDIVNLRESQADVSQYDRIIIGSAVYMGRIRKEVKKFIEQNINMLLEKNIGLFLCCMTEDESEQDELVKRVFPDALIKHAMAVVIPGGEFRIDRMNIFERFIVSKIAGQKENKSMIDNDKIENFAEKMSKKGGV